MDLEVSVVNAKGQEVERLTFAPSVLDERLRSRLLKEAVVMYQANKRVGTHDTKTRSDVEGPNRKPWRQKGTGRARAGTRKSPLWRGGGIVFGPHPRDYSYQINKKQRRRALRSALLAKFRSGQVKVVDRIELSAPKTKEAAAILKAVGARGKILIGSETLDRNLWLSARNIAEVTILPVDDFNALEVLRAATVVLTKPALSRLLEKFGSNTAESAGDTN
jgi:large subunit ribosomal protein L4